MKTFHEIMTDPNILYLSALKCRKNCDWKKSVQIFSANILKEVHRFIHEFSTSSYKQSNFTVFKLRERGKTRVIRAMCIYDRMVQRTICDNVLLPLLRKYLIYDNGASLEGTGLSFTRKRLQAHIEKYVRRHGVNGYVLKLDFSKFFDNIRHDTIKKIIFSKILDKEAQSFIAYLIDSFRLNVSYMSDEQYEDAYENGINTLDHYRHSDAYNSDGTKFIPKSLGIGSQISQICGLLIAHRIDNYCKIVRRCKYYGRYMDDIYIIHDNKEFLHDICSNIHKIAKDLGLVLNPRKTSISTLHRGFTFMQIKYRVTSSGHIVKIMCSSRFSRERKRLRSYRRLLDKGVLTRKDISVFYASWRGNIKCDNRRSLFETDKLYCNLFLNN